MCFANRKIHIWIRQKWNWESVGFHIWKVLWFQLLLESNSDLDSITTLLTVVPLDRSDSYSYWLSIKANVHPLPLFYLLYLLSICNLQTEAKEWMNFCAINRSELLFLSVLHHYQRFILCHSGHTGQDTWWTEPCMGLNFMAWRVSSRRGPAHWPTFFLCPAHTSY